MVGAQFLKAGTSGVIKMLSNVRAERPRYGKKAAIKTAARGEKYYYLADFLIALFCQAQIMLPSQVLS